MPFISADRLSLKEGRCPHRRSISQAALPPQIWSAVWKPPLLGFLFSGRTRTLDWARLNVGRIIQRRSRTHRRGGLRAGQRVQEDAAFRIELPVSRHDAFDEG